MTPHPNLDDSRAVGALSTGQADHWPATADLVLLCSFGEDLTDRPSGAQLRRSLVAAGFRPREARHILHTSPLLDRHRNDTYALRPTDIS